MAFLSMSLFSSVLDMDMNVNVLLPENRKGSRDRPEPDRKYPVLYCLHGHGDDHTAWIRKSNIETAVRDYQVIAVMPAMHRSFYSDVQYGMKYYTWLTEELPVKITNFFPADTRPENTYLIGNSMGGFGALKLFLGRPGQYRACAALSPAIPQDLYHWNNDFTEMMTRAVGTKEEIAGSVNDLYTLADRCTCGKDAVLYMTCGSEDFISCEGFRRFDQYLKSSTHDFVYQSEEAAGGHNWEFWNPQILKSIALFGFRRIGE